jgi:hypothetical protein
MRELTWPQPSHINTLTAYTQVDVSRFTRRIKTELSCPLFNSNPTIFDMSSPDAPGYAPEEARPILTDVTLAAGMDGTAGSLLDQWMRQLGLDDRLVHFDEAFRDDLEPQLTYHTPSLKSIESMSCMAPELIRQEPTRSRAPSLRDDKGETEATPTETSVSTSLASHFSGVPLLEETHGVLETKRAQFRAPIYE